MALLEVRDLRKSYGRRAVVNGVSFEVEAGEVVGLLGPNGAGKTTSFRMTIGLISSDGGQVLFNGKDISRLPMFERARAGMGYLAQDSSVFKLLSVENNLKAILETRKDLSRKERKLRLESLLAQFGLTQIRKTQAARVSGGERRRLEIARSLITEPKLIMLDEPFAGIDPKTVSEIQDSIRLLATEHQLGILLTDHQFRETLEVTDRCFLIRQGEVFASGDRAAILANPDVRRYYIGERFDVGHLLDLPPHRNALDGKPSATGVAGSAAAPSPSPSPAATKAGAAVPPRPPAASSNHPRRPPGPAPTTSTTFTTHAIGFDALIGDDDDPDDFPTTDDGSLAV
jgi:lipopolysaccharide export system ATP-binding protein